MANITVTLYWDMDLRKWTTTLGGTTETDPIQGLVQGDIVKFAVRFVQTGVAVVLAAPVFTASGIKADNDFTGSYLIQLSAPVLSDTTLYTFTVNPLNSANLNTFLQTYRNTWCALEIYDSVNGILTTPLELQIMPGYSLSGTPTDNVAGVIVVAAGKTVTFPQSLTFPSALGTNGFQLTTDGAGALTWATAGISGITIGTTTANGTAGRVLYTDGALVQQYAISGTGSVAMTNAPTLVTPVLGAATATSINGTFIGSSANLTRFVSMASGVSYINLEGNSVGGYIDTSATVGGTSYSGGYISTAGGLTSLGGNINTSGSGSNAGGNITTSGGGGTIDTTGNGSIGLGIAANRTYLVSTAGNNEKTATFPNVTGTVAVAATSATATQALFATATAGAPAYREIATADIATALTTPGAIGGTTASTGAFTTLSGTSTLTLGVVSATAGTIVLRNATNAFTTTIVPSVVTASRQLNLPLITGTDTVAVLGLAQTFTGNKTFSGTVSCGSTLAVSSTTTMTGRLTANGGITVVGGLYLLTTNSALSDGSSINTGTLTNAPDVGNPTKWIAINDNGTERYIPTWTLPPA
jgi:hypothetical protein